MIKEDNLRYPLGKFVLQTNITYESRRSLIKEIPQLVPELRNLVNDLETDQISTPYREGGWPIKKIIHHMADNDLNAYLRFKRALTEEEPKASSYREDLWAELVDYEEIPIENSILLLETVHYRFYILLKNIEPRDFERVLHTEALGKINLDIALQRFIWHNRHHRAQIESFINKNKGIIL